LLRTRAQPRPRLLEALAEGGVIATARRDSVRVELACFAALAIFVSWQWVVLVDRPPIFGAAVVVAIATATGAALAALSGSTLPPPARWFAAAAISAAAIAIALVVIGIPARMLAPGGWDQLRDRLGQSLDGVGGVSVPYDGTDRWTRLTILGAAPLAVGLAAAATFWPARRRFIGRAIGLVLLLVLYVTTVAWRPPEGELGQGVILLGLLAAWLWGPALSRRGAIVGAAGIFVAALCVVPIAAAIEGNGPFWNYREWRLFGSGGVGFDWDHSYGPLEWPQVGTPLLTVASDGAHYWKTENLDVFDGVGWRRAPRPAPEPFLGEPAVIHDSSGRGLHADDPWVDRINFEVHGLRTDVVVGAGTTLRVRRVAAKPSADAIWTLSEGLHSGDQYTVLAYTPDPTPAQMRGAGTDYPAEARHYTALSLPGESGATSSVQVPFWPRSRESAVVDDFAGGPYERTYALTRELAAGAATPYAAARRIERGLRSRYAYDQDVPDHDLPLPAFLFEDRRGYCQQFSGAMALMLRMLGIPARVSTGFAPGGRDPERGTFLVEDLDAHSWVEVFFPKIGWVPFEPTPPQAPAEAQLDDNAIGATGSKHGSVLAGSEDPNPTSGGDDGAAAPEGPQHVASTGDGGGGGIAIGAIAAIGTGAILVLACVLYGARALRRRFRQPDRLAAAELAELRRALLRLGFAVEPETTLLQLERELLRVGPAASAYAARLRERRFRDPEVRPPGAAERRALRQALIGSAGARALLALPPGGPR
jgi:transglutaminase-like putative cysteine protease